METPDIPLLLEAETILDAEVIAGYPIGIQNQYIFPAVNELIYIEAPVLATERTAMLITLGLTREAELSDGEVLT